MTPEEARAWSTPDEEARALATLSGWRETQPLFHIVITVLLITGMRFSELRALSKEDLDLQAPGLWVRRSQARRQVSTPKNKRARFQYVPRTLADELQAWMLRSEGQLLFPGPTGGPLPNNTLNRALTRLAAEAGVSRVTSHGLRHTAGTSYAAMGAGHRRIASLLGQADMKSTERYTHAVQDGLGELVEGGGSEWAAPVESTMGEPCGCFGRRRRARGGGACSKLDGGSPATRASENMTKPRFQLAQSDAVDWLRALPAASVDMVVTDPAYESLEKHRAVGTTTRLKHSKASSNDWFSIFPNDRFPELFAEVWRVLRKGSHFYLFCDQETMFVAKPLAEAAGFKFWKPLIWDKKKIGMGYHYRARYEVILFFEKGKRKLNNLGVPDIIEAPRIYKGYPTEKPVEVGEVLVEQSTQPGELVVDPFMGSGAFGVAATGLGRSFAGSDLCTEAVDIARGRLSEGGAAEARLFSEPRRISRREGAAGSISSRASA